MPLAIPLTYFLFLPPNAAFFSLPPGSYEALVSSSEAVSDLPYTSLATNEEEIREEEDVLAPLPKGEVALNLDDKWRLVKPLLSKYMLPLCKYDFSSTSSHPNIITSFGVFSTCLHSVQPRLAEMELTMTV